MWKKGRKVVPGALVVALCAGAMSPMPALANGFIETFDEDPDTTGWSVMNGEDESRFAYQSASQSLLAHYDSSKPTARYVRTLGRTLTHNDAFSYRVSFTINSAGFSAHPDGLAQLAFGLLNTATTGPLRSDALAGDAFDLVSFDYFPNVSNDYGGPTLAVTLISSNTGGTMYDAMDFEQGQETMLDDAGESPLPLDVLLTAEVRYDADTQQAVLRVLQQATPLPINEVGKNSLPGGEDGDTTTIVTTFTHLAEGFAVNAFGILLWEDVWGVWTDPEAIAVVADLEFESVAVCWPSFGDFDGDCDVDQDDFDMFQDCSSGPMVPRAPGCELFDADGDNDVDQQDFGELQVLFTGPK